MRLPAALCRGPARRTGVPGAARRAPAHERMLQHELRHALARDQFHLVYQPICSVEDGATRSFEALLRWEHPSLGSIEPQRFIGLAEDSGLILDIGDWVFRAAADECLRLRRGSASEVRVGVNVTQMQLASRPTTQLWVRYLHDIGLPCEAMTLEITERTVSRWPERVADHLAQLADSGLRISIDDFGTGYSNLAMLAQLRPHSLKLDASLVQGLAACERSRTIAHAVVSMAHRLHMQVVAEGIELPAQAHISRELGCDLGQGWWYSRPLSPAQLPRRLAAAA